MKTNPAATTLAVVVVCTLLCCLPLVLNYDRGAGLYALLTGWAASIGRVWRTKLPDWSALATLATCLAILIVSGDRAAVWLRRSLFPEATPWRWRQTVGTVAMAVFLAACGVTLLCATHQTAWLINSPVALSYYSCGNYSDRVHRYKVLGLGIVNTFEADPAPTWTSWDADGSATHGWQTKLLPFIEEDHVAHGIDTSKSWDHPDNRKAFAREVRWYLFPDRQPYVTADGYALSHVAGNVHVFGQGKEFRLEALAHGRANTVLVGGAPGDPKPWAYPRNWADPNLPANTPGGFASTERDGGVMVVMADGSVRVLRPKSGQPLQASVAEE